MREYELVLVLHPELDDTSLTDAINKVKGWISDNGGDVTKIDLWGKKRLAYPIRKLSDGHYVLMNLTMNPKFGITLERNLRFLEPVLRFLLIVK